MASMTMTSAFFGALAPTKQLSTTTTSRRGLVVMANATKVEKKEESGRRVMMFAVAAAAAASVAKIAMAAEDEEPKRGTAAAKKKYGPVCVTMPTARICHIKSALTEKALQIFCETYHIPDEVHLQLPNLDQTIHEMPTGKISVYTRLFEYANFRLPLSTFFVDVLIYYRIHISQLSVIGATKVSHFEVLCRAHGFEPTVGLFRCLYVNSKNKGWMSFSKRPRNNAVCYTKPLDSLKNWNDRFFWVDAFACPASFPWNTSKSVPKNAFPTSSEFNAEHYATLVAHPAPFHKYPEPFLCLVGISRYYTLDENTYP
ncbi:putative gypsy type transposase [Tanacetum coccineum]